MRRRNPSKIESGAVLVLLLLLFFSARCNASTVSIDTPIGKIELQSPLGFDAMPELESTQNHLAELRIKGKATFTPSELTLEHRNYLTDSGYAVCIFWTGAKERSIPWTCTTADGRSYRFLVKVGDGSDPDPDPDDPELNKRAAYIRDQALKVDQPATAQRIGDAYGSVAAQIGAGTINSLPEAKRAIEAEMAAITPLDRKWKPLGDAIIKAFQEDAQSLPDAQKLFKDVADGLWAAVR